MSSVRKNLSFVILACSLIQGSCGVIKTIAMIQRQLLAQQQQQQQQQQQIRHDPQKQAHQLQHQLQLLQQERVAGLSVVAQNRTPKKPQPVGNVHHEELKTFARSHVTSETAWEWNGATRQWMPMKVSAVQIPKKKDNKKVQSRKVAEADVAKRGEYSSWQWNKDTEDWQWVQNVPTHDAEVVEKAVKDDSTSEASPLGLEDVGMELGASSTSEAADAMRNNARHNKKQSGGKSSANIGKKIGGHQQYSNGTGKNAKKVAGLHAEKAGQNAEAKKGPSASAQKHAGKKSMKDSHGKQDDRDDLAETADDAPVPDYVHGALGGQVLTDEDEEPQEFHPAVQSVNQPTLQQPVGMQDVADVDVSQRPLPLDMAVATDGSVAVPVDAAEARQPDWLRSIVEDVVS